MINPTGAASATNASLSIDPKEMESLRQSAKQNSPEALKAVAKQFEGLFMNMIMKSMRDATPKDGMLDSEQGKMFTSMLDQQLSQNFAKRGVGLADVLIRQLSGPRGSGPADAGGDAVLPEIPGVPGIPGLSGLPRPNIVPAASAAGAVVQPERPRAGQAAHIRAFEDKLGAHAEDAARSTGIPAKFMLGQAALESGWGKREILAADGSSSHNVFGIKAGAGWKGKVVETATTEYVHGVPERKIERFRAYDSYGDAFRDYAHTLQKNPRYQAVLANAQDVQGFAQGLQRAGYATDPHYAAKLTRIITHSLSA